MRSHEIPRSDFLAGILSALSYFVAETPTMLLLYYHKYNYSSKYLYIWDIYHVHLKYIGAISLPKVSYVWRVSNQLLFKKDPIEKGSLIFQEGKAAAASRACVPLPL